MKKLLTLSFSLLSALALVACGGPAESSETPSTGSTGDTSVTSDTSSEDVSSSSTISETSIDTGSLDDGDRIQTYYFYIDYWHSDEAIYELKWWQGLPLGSCPEECRLTNADATDPLFPNFLGWSLYSSSIDDSQLWNFATDSKFPLIVKLYGIWVSD